jgi:hypothetical protein
MNMPGFTAESSFYEMSNLYSAAIESAHANDFVYPAQVISSNTPFIPLCWRYRCYPMIGVNGGISWKCGWFKIC